MVFATALIGLSGCSSPAPPAKDLPAEVATPEPADGLPPVEFDRRTTNGERATANLRKQIEVMDRPRQIDGRLSLLGLEVALLGEVDALDAQLEIAETPEQKARALVAVHRFDEALKTHPETAKDRVALARHQDLERLETEARAAVEKRGDTRNWTHLGNVLAVMERPEEADQAYWNALQAYKDVNPFTVADLQFKRGLLYGESGLDPARAEALYQDAVARLPGFVRAQVHLAELERDKGASGGAILRMEGLVDAGDPEPVSKLAVWLTGKDAEPHRKAADARYAALLAKHPLAFADHATEYFLASGQAEQARKYARMNVENRDTPRARELCERASCRPAAPAAE